MKLVLLLFLLTLCSSQLPLNDTNSNTCIPRLIDRSKFLSDAEYNELCDILNKYPLFMIRLRREIDYAIQGAVFFEASSFKYFDTECNKYTDMWNMVIRKDHIRTPSHHDKIFFLCHLT